MPKYLAELIGTFALLFCGTGAVMVNELSGGAVTHLGISIVFGFVVMVVVYSVGFISGAHINPAVTIAFAASGALPKREVVPYILAQLAGALLASGALRLLFPDAITMGETLPTGSVLQSFVLEVILTFLLMFVIFQVVTGPPENLVMAGFIIGMAVMLLALFGGPISGASMNPARSVAPAIVAGKLQHLWIYIVAPVLGALGSYGAHRVITMGEASLRSDEDAN
ncbi:MAG: aquaporin [Bacteroidota bacterium]